MGLPVFFLLLLLCLSSGAAVAQGPPLQLWCVAKNNADDSALQSSLDWACGPGGADCSPIQNNGACYDSSNLPRMASFAFNDYFIKNGLTDDSCNFSNTAALTSLNPSYKKCKFPSSLSRGNGNFNGSMTGGSAANGDLSRSNTILNKWEYWGWILVHLIFGITLIFGL